MASKKGETRQCANTSRVSVSETLRETNMKSIANSELNFHGINLSPVPQMNDIWLTSSDLARALGYASSKSVSTIYSRNSDEFTSSMSMVIKMMTNGINNNLREKSVRVFSLRGCHLIAMFATTDKAKEFRRWVLDILDREVALGNAHPAFDFEMYAHNAKVAAGHFEVIYRAWCEQLSPSLRAVGSPLAVDMVDRLKSLGAITMGLSCVLGKAAREGKFIH
ncbi:BRO-N domain-containing protein [Serratia marcescens]